MKISLIKKSFIILLMLIPVVSYSQAGKAGDKNKKLVWSDEFNYKGLPDEKFWNFEIGKWRANNEPQYYTKNPQNINVDKGKLTITCRIEDIDGERRYTSARINTKGKYEFTYGRAEARMKLPSGRGVWPAFWTLGTEGTWPACGEIDIMEFWGHNPDTIAANVHTRDYNHTKGTGRGGKIKVKQPWKGFHVYAVEWFEDHMDFYFDDNLYYTCVSKGEGPGEWPFDKPEYLILNFALWNNLKEKPSIDDSIFPQDFIIDYVRVYELK